MKLLLNKYFPYFVILCLIISWLIGSSREVKDNNDEQLKKASPEGVVFKTLDEDVYSVYESNNIFSKPSGYIAIAEANGYSGLIRLSITIDKKGIIQRLNIIRQTETPVFFTRLDIYDYYSQFIGKKIAVDFKVGNGIDGVTAATISCVGVAQAVNKASMKLTKAIPEFVIEKVKKARIQIKLPEIILIIIFLLGYIAMIRVIPYKKTIRWLTIILSIVFMGFLYATPMSMADINTILFGNFPNIHTHLIWYVIIIGVYLPVIIRGVNPYFTHICPFGGTQEVLAKIGGAKIKVPYKIASILHWLPKFLSLGIVMFALISRNQGFYGHEILGTAFTFNGTLFQYILLVIMIISSLFIKRPWCRFFCPVKPTVDSVRWGRRTIKGLFTRR